MRVQPYSSRVKCPDRMVPRAPVHPTTWPVVELQAATGAVHTPSEDNEHRTVAVDTVFRLHRRRPSREEPFDQCRVLSA